MVEPWISESFQAQAPFSISGAGGNLLAGKFDSHLLAIPRGAPDWNRLAALQDRTVGEQWVGFHIGVQ